MIAVIFEVEPDPDRKDAYLDMAATMRKDLEQIEGFISVERFQSITNPEKMLSLSFFESEDAVKNWRNLPSHRKAQSMGRGGMFNGYRLRVSQVLRDYTMTDRAEAPADSLKEHG